MIEKQCPICGRPDCDIKIVPVQTNHGHEQPVICFHGDCLCCGLVYINRSLVFDNLETGQISKQEFLGYLRQHSLIREHTGSKTIKIVQTIDDLREGFFLPSTPFDQVYMLIEYIASKQPSLSEFVRFDASKDYPICFAKNESDFCFIIKSAYELGYIKGRGKNDDPIMDNGGKLHLTDELLMLTMKGWEKEQELKEQSPYSNQVFVAFHFDTGGTMKQIYDTAIAPAVSECGLIPYVTLDDEHGNSITDVIIAGIRKSRFVIADVTDASQNVYYEAGFAYGLGIPVILTCREDRTEEDMKFDTSHIKHILWKDEADLKQRLINRIEAMGLSKKI
ncbi:MAG: hypothetical protein CVU50_09305 [Candidatus Cloacimonetes bacterium HGW-Cloacimonetes-3]|jgi:hypothetical protein|nr:MAG: hypothetical protein CVU50_09305 [Candidatus Cloacimonetes bacterium HGW-Cloacimonetes-3]